MNIIIWCEACGSVAGDGQCDCTRLNTGTQRLVSIEKVAKETAEILRERARGGYAFDADLETAADIIDVLFSGAAPKKKPRKCIECGKNWADPPSAFCPGCEAYLAHLF